VNYTNSYTINGSLFQEFLSLLGRMTQGQLIRQIEYMSFRKKRGQRKGVTPIFSPFFKEKEEKGSHLFSHPFLGLPLGFTSKLTWNFSFNLSVNSFPPNPFCC